MYVNLDNIIRSKNITCYSLSKEIDCDYQSLSRLINNKTTAISFNLLEDICLYLNCSPSDILIVEKPKK